MDRHRPDNRQRALKLLEIYGGGVDDFFKFWPADKEYFISSDKKAFLAYRLQGKTCVCMGDPAGQKASIDLLLEEFKQMLETRGQHAVFIQTNGRYSDEYRQAGFSKLLIGSDAVIDLDNFLDTTVHSKYFRNIVNRFEKKRYSFEVSPPPHSRTILKSVSMVSESWLDLQGKKEWSFLTGRLDKDYLGQVTLFVLKDETGQAQAFVNQLPSYEHGVATIDLMRRRSDSLPNTMDYLFICIMRHLQSEGYSRFNMGMSPLDSRPGHGEIAAKILRLSYKLSNRFIGFRGLHQFKAKYKPDWEPRYVCYQGRPGRLPQYGLAIYRLMLK